MTRLIHEVFNHTQQLQADIERSNTTMIRVSLNDYTLGSILAICTTIFLTTLFYSSFKAPFNPNEAYNKCIKGAAKEQWDIGICTQLAYVPTEQQQLQETIQETQE